MYLQLFRENTEQANRKARQMTFLLQALFLLLSVSICIWMKEIFGLLVNNAELQAAYPIAIILLMSFNYRPMYLAAINKLMFQEKTKALWKISLLAGVANVALNFVFLPIYGIFASAVITFSTFMYAGYAGFYMKEFKESNRLNYKPTLWLQCTVVALVFSYYFVEMAVNVKLAFSFVLIIIVLSLFYVKVIKQKVISFN